MTDAVLDAFDDVLGEIDAIGGLTMGGDPVAYGVAAVAATVPLGRLGEPEDVGDVCLFLSSPLASYVSGASILLHGGGERPAFLDAAKQPSE